MRYIVSVGTGLLIILLLYGYSMFAVLAGANDSDTGVIYIDTQDEAENLREEIDRLKTIATIRDVLEDYYPSVSIEEKREVAESIYDACKLYDLKVELVLAVIKTESAFNDTAASHKGALGLMQVLPRTGNAIAEEIDLELENKLSLFDRRTNILLGSYYLKKMLDRYKSLDYALLAYNTGPTRLDQMLLQKNRLSGEYAEMVHRNMKMLAVNYFTPTTNSDQ